jgi:hypothetical protein
MPALLQNHDQSLFGSDLSLTSVYGDTLCKFNNYDTYIIPSGQGSSPRISSKIYRLDGHVMLQKGFNDTIFRVTPPNRLTPAYVMQWGKFKADIQSYMTLGNMEGKAIMGEWVESPRSVFIRYTEGADSPISRRDGKTKDHWAIYDKKAKTLTHLISDNKAMRELNVSFRFNRPMPALIENDIDSVGMPFWPEGVNHRGEMYMIFPKQDVKIYIDTGKFPKDKLQAIYNNMPEDSFCLMIVK